MDATKLLGSINGLTGNAKSSSVNSAKSDSSVDFGGMLEDAIQGTVNAQRASEKMTVAAAQGEDVPMHEVIQAVNKAEITLQTMVNVRDKAMEAYQEILRMPI